MDLTVSRSAFSRTSNLDSSAVRLLKRPIDIANSGCMTQVVLCRIKSRLPNPDRSYLEPEPRQPGAFCFFSESVVAIQRRRSAERIYMLRTDRRAVAWERNYSLVTLLSLPFATQMLAPSKAIPSGVVPTPNVPRLAPSLARSLVTLSLPSFVTQTLAPSKAMPHG
jgi:hypothetical protein